MSQLCLLYKERIYVIQEYMWQERVLGRFSQLSSLSMLNCTTFFLTIWDFVHEVNLTYEFFEIINKRNIVSDYENEMYSFVFV